MPQSKSTSDESLDNLAGNLPDFGYLRQKKVLTILPFSGSTLWRKVRAGEFPEPVKLSPRITAWRVADIKKWLRAKEARRGQ